VSQRPPAAINGHAAAARIAPVRPRGSLITALDIGSTKVCCFIARVEAAPRILGIGHQIARGVRGGAIVDLEGVGHSIRSAVHAAEEMAGEQIERVVVSLSGGFAGSRIVKAEIDVARREISDSDMRQVLERTTVRSSTRSRSASRSTRAAASATRAAWPASGSPSTCTS